MSEWAIGDGDNEERTAYEYRELYLDQGIEFEPFHCPFCGVLLTPVNLYKAGDIARSPHFRADKEPHRFGCDGYPEPKATAPTGSPKGRVDKREFRLPETLVPRRRPITQRPGAADRRPTDSPDAAEVRRRRCEGAERLGSAVYRTSLVRSVAIAFLGVFRESHKEQKEHRWTDAQRREWETKLLRESPLTLYDGYMLTYAAGIRNTKYAPPAKPRIFHGWGVVAGLPGDNSGYMLKPAQWVEQGEGKDVKRFPVELVIQTESGVDPTASQRLVVKRLAEAASSNQEVRWFAYGVMRQDDDGVYRMSVESLDHVYVHALRKPVN